MVRFVAAKEAVVPFQVGGDCVAIGNAVLISKGILTEGGGCYDVDRWDYTSRHIERGSRCLCRRHSALVR